MKSLHLPETIFGKEQNISLKNLNVLIGKNGSGKTMVCNHAAISMQGNEKNVYQYPPNFRKVMIDQVIHYRKPLHLKEDGSNLFCVAANMDLKTSEIGYFLNLGLFNKFCHDYLRLELIFKVIENQVVQLRINNYDKNLSESISNGQYKFMCLASILLSKTKNDVVFIENPETGLHPDLLGGIADLLFHAAKTKQIFITTHSDILLSAIGQNLDTANIIICERKDYQIIANCLSPEYIKDFMEHDGCLGQLWTSGQIGGNVF